MEKLFTDYSTNPSGFVEVFKEGVESKCVKSTNYGTGDRKKFQELSKISPSFAAEFTAIGLRNNRKHWGALSKKSKYKKIEIRTVEIRPECDEMLKKVQRIVDKFDLCQLLR